MYTYKSARIRQPDPRPRWKSRDLATTPLEEIYDLYRSAIVELEHPLYEDTLKLDMWVLKEHFNVRHSRQTLRDFLKGLGNKSLPTTQHYPELEAGYATFVDAVQAGFDVQPVNTVFNHDVPLPKDSFYDLRLTHPTVNPREMFDTCLVTVNGLFHRTNYTGDSVNALEGAVSFAQSQRYQVGVMNLGPLGKITTVPIHVRHVSPGNAGEPLSNKAFLEVDPKAGDLDGKSVLLCIGGYLHLPGEVGIERSGERTWTVDFANYPHATRYFEMLEFLNIDNITRHLEKSSVNDTQVLVDELYSDKVIRELFALSQSFFVVVDTPELFLDRETIEPGQLTGSFVAHESPRYLLKTGTGRFREYWTRYEYDCFVLNIEDGLKPNYLFETTGWREVTSVDDSRVPSHTDYFTDAYFWKLGTYYEK